jgi:hypothetical protein
VNCQEPAVGLTLVLGPGESASAPTPASAPARAASRRPRRPARADDGRRAAARPRLATGAAAGALLAILAAALLWRQDRDPRLVPPAVAVPVDPAAITATASSTQEPDGTVTYAAGNTLDGDPATAWNSNGGVRGKSTGISLTYSFSHPLRLRGIVVRNGYQKVRQRPGHGLVDLYPANARVRRVRVVTDAGRWTWDLADTHSPQAFTGAAGQTRSVRLEILSAYPSTTYPDVAVSEVSFTAALS